MTNEQLVSTIWNYAHVMRDQGVSYSEQITYLLFLKMDQEREDLRCETSAIPLQWSWAQIASKDGDALELQYRYMLEALGRVDGLIGTIFRKTQNKLSDPAKLTVIKEPCQPNRRTKYDLRATLRVIPV
ncbi:type I restriction-modification system subunit M N-terminal domain-containing protein [Cognatishimia sp. F0-27]|uniref:type I restriction-modification system subunit M N-terminal domain-containing protein n=1 Tax=Cognatishimia sp. F0-27 TaxID=2816855 RepID=UPI001D0C2C09|nr:type I restriction-modification system subunit M N-terminal domain-containing protein [Cognatishimia sp. F0-27]MCC1494945.1 type I restriction-modification system subunit M N-terminal domain-containing protein [Cognatishimia sp. F0-27]